MNDFNFDYIKWKKDNYTTHCTCKKCGKEATVDDSIILTSFPPKYNYECPHCGEHGYVLCSETYRKNNTDINEEELYNNTEEK